MFEHILRYADLLRVFYLKFTSSKMLGQSNLRRVRLCFFWFLGLPLLFLLLYIILNFRTQSSNRTWINGTPSAKVYSAQSEGNTDATGVEFYNASDENEGDEESKYLSRNPKPYARIDNEKIIVGQANTSIDDNNDTEKLDELFTNNNSYFGWIRPPRNIWMVKIPKTGGTTLAEVLFRVANYSQWKVAHPLHSASVDTCRQHAQPSWSDFVHEMGGRLDLFASHACFQPFMKAKQFWSLDRQPHVITLMRKPWDQFISKYRFVNLCCESRHWSWCRGLCNHDEQGSSHGLSLPQYISKACIGNLCNAQWLYMDSGRFGTSEDALDEFKMVLLLERLDEGLVLMHIKMGVPFAALPYMKANENVQIPMPEVSESTRHNIERYYIHKDNALYSAAMRRFDDQLANLNNHERSLFNDTYKLLKETNHLASQICIIDCGAHAPLSQERKECDQLCLQRIVSSLQDAQIR
jgi:hypothetical protein